MPENERRRRIPEWAERERLNDMAWIAENMAEFWDAAQRGFAEFGRGAVTVDTTIQPVPGKGNPMWYFTQEQVAEHFSEDEIRMVAEYDPTWQFVSILLKAQNRTSAYRMGVPGQEAGGGGTHRR